MKLYQTYPPMVKYKLIHLMKLITVNQVRKVILTKIIILIQMKQILKILLVLLMMVLQNMMLEKTALLKGMIRIVMLLNLTLILIQVMERMLILMDWQIILVSLMNYLDFIIVLSIGSQKISITLKLNILQELLMQNYQMIGMLRIPTQWHISSFISMRKFWKKLLKTAI